jgi:hypothetical protein
VEGLRQYQHEDQKQQEDGEHLHFLNFKVASFETELRFPINRAFIKPAVSF